MISDTDISLRIHGPADAATLVYLPGMHGDWTLIPSFRARVLPKVRFVELSYPRTVEWTLADYGEAISRALADHGIERGWILGESWGSQPTWWLAGRSMEAATASVGSSRQIPAVFQPEGLILAGGFVRHPWPWAVALTRRRGEAVPLPTLNRFLRIYPLYARLRLRHAPETLAEMPQFLERRTEADRRAAMHRLRLMEANDLRPVARAYQGPVHALSGAIDPIVPWPWVRRWLSAQCPGYRGGRVLWAGDHNVLNSQGAAEQVLAWMGR